MMSADKILRGINSIVFTNGKLIFMKYILRKNIKFSKIHVISANTKIEVDKQGQLSLGKMDNITNCRLLVRGNAILQIDDEVFLNSGVFITCRENVQIGRNTLFGPNVLIYDHDHQLAVNGGVKKKEFITKPVKIGSNCWIGAGTIILKGTVLGDNSIVGAGSILNGIYPENSVIVQKRETTIVAKTVS